MGSRCLVAEDGDQDWEANEDDRKLGGSTWPRSRKKIRQRRENEGGELAEKAGKLNFLSGS
jgi:hypothetical protein